MAFKLAVAPLVDVPVKVFVQDGVQRRAVSFTLVGKRLAESAITDEIRRDERTAGEFLSGVIVDWRGQTLVLDEQDNSPAAFSAGAFACLLSLQGMAASCFDAYVRANGVEGKRGN